MSARQIRLGGTVSEGSRLEVELWVGGEHVASGSEGARVELATAEGPVEVDVSGLALADRPTSVERGPWAELSSRPESRLVAASSPAPASRAELRVRRLDRGDAVTLVVEPDGDTFEGPAGPRHAPSRRLRRATAVRLAPAPEPPRPARRDRVLGYRLMLRLAAFAVLIALGAAAAIGADLASALIALAHGLSVAGAYRLASRAVEGAPVMDEGVANPFVRGFARGARSLPRLSPTARDGSRRAARWLGLLGTLGWVYLVFIAAVWAGAMVTGRLVAERLDPAGVAGLLGGQALALAVLALAYRVFDLSEAPRVRALLDALSVKGEWRAFVGVVEEGELTREVLLESDHGDSESVRFYASHDETRADHLRVIGDDGAKFDVPTRSALWAAAEVEETPTTATMRVGPGSRVIVGAFFDADRPSARGPGSVVLYASPGDPVAELRRGLAARRRDAIVAGALASLVAGVALVLLASSPAVRSLL